MPLVHTSYVIIAHNNHTPLWHIRLSTREMDMQIQITLTGSGGVLDGQTIVVHDEDDGDSTGVSHAIQSVIETWVLAPGDTITITQC
jgi:hypothetical protein